MSSYQYPFYLLFAIVAIFFIQCKSANSQGSKGAPPSSKEFKDYWYAGNAELNRYRLEQARYGEIHEGDAILIFVTEDFDTKQQVKHERGEKRNVASVLKLNATRKFYTGIYPYSMMSSIFTPVINEPTLKVSTTSQEWCGHTFSQLNFREEKYQGQMFSYFQQEGDRQFEFDKALLEDEIWNKIRLNPSSLPTGDIHLVPGSMYLRLKHRPFGIESAVASLKEANDPALSDHPLKAYEIKYNDFERTLKITFEAQFPYAIISWEESYPSGYGPGAKPLLTRAVRTHVMNAPYWTQHDVADGRLRAELGMD